MIQFLRIIYSYLRGGYPPLTAAPLFLYTMRRKRKLLISILSILLGISLAFNILMIIRLKDNGVSLFESGTVALTTENYDKYIRIYSRVAPTGTCQYVENETGLFYDTIDYRLDVVGTSDYKYEGVTVKVRQLIKASGYTNEDVADTRNILHEYDFKILEKGNTEDFVHETQKLDNFWVNHEGLFTDYEVVDITGKVKKK